MRPGSWRTTISEPSDEGADVERKEVRVGVGFPAVSAVLCHCEPLIVV